MGAKNRDSSFLPFQCLRKLQALLRYISLLPPTKFLMRMKALKGKHFHVPRVTCPLPEATITLSPLPKIIKPALPGLEQLPLVLHIPVPTAAQLLVSWP